MQSKESLFGFQRARAALALACVADANYRRVNFSVPSATQATLARAVTNEEHSNNVLYFHKIYIYRSNKA